jgi:hypothetical protein
MYSASSAKKTRDRFGVSLVVGNAQIQAKDAFQLDDGLRKSVRPSDFDLSAAAEEGLKRRKVGQ